MTHTTEDIRRHFPPASSPARERVMAVAERLFAERGYAAVTLRDIAGELGIKQASLYHHVPGGKEEMYVEVMERSFARHKAGLTEAITVAGPDIHAQLMATMRWVLSQPPMDLGRFMRSDMAELTPAHADRLQRVAYDALFMPVMSALFAARGRGDIRTERPANIAGMVLSIVQSIVMVRDTLSTGSFAERTRDADQMASDAVDMILNGIRTRE